MSLCQRGFCNSPLNWKMRNSLHPDILAFIRSVQNFPLSWRKLSLAVTRVQISPHQNKRLQDIVDSVREEDIQSIITPATSTFYTLEDLLNSLHLISSSIYLCSVYSYIVRAEKFKESDVAHIRDDGILKEVSASLQTDLPRKLE